MNLKRIRQLNREKEQTNIKYEGKAVAYWMARDQRVQDNWALIAAAEKAKKSESELIVFFNVYRKIKHNQQRHYDFMIGGLKKVENTLKELGICFDVRVGDAQNNLIEFIEENEVTALYTDFSPLKHSQNLKKEIANKLEIPFFEIDAHNIVPVWEASTKQEYAARTIRPKIHNKLKEFLDEYPNTDKFLKEIAVLNEEKYRKSSEIKWDALLSKVETEEEVEAVDWIKPGEDEAFKMLQGFLKSKLDDYDEKRNDANANGISNLSPYLHFGQVSAQRIVLELFKKLGEPDLENAFFEELVVRRELADNFCFYNENYDNPKGFPDWAKKTLLEHKDDPREYLYTLEQLEKAQTHDELWNASQQEMVKKGKMHGYMRMYWAKKILQWTPNVGTAMKYAIYLNDKYELDGRDPNGYVGIAWSMGGVHDRPWFDREIFGTVRYMAESGCKKKFDVEEYIAHN